MDSANRYLREAYLPALLDKIPTLQIIDEFGWPSLDLKQRSLQAEPLLVVGEGAMGFWAAIEEEFPKSGHPHVRRSLDWRSN